MKKVVSLLLLVLISFSFSGANALLVKPSDKDLILTRENLKEIRNGEKYISQIDEVISVYGKNQRVLELLTIRVSSAKTKLTTANRALTSVERNVLVILKYLDIKVQLAIYNLEN